MIKDRNTRTRKQAVIDLIERELSQLYRVGFIDLCLLFRIL